MTTKVRLCCFCSSRHIKAGPHRGHGSDELVSPFTRSPPTASTLKASGSQFGSPQDGDGDLLVKQNESICQTRECNDYSTARDLPFSKGAKLRSRFVYKGRDSGFLPGGHRTSSSSLTDPLMESSSIRENDSCWGHDEESCTVGESGQWACSSYHRREAFEAAVRPSRFINMDSQSTSDFDDSLLVDRSHQAQRSEHMATESSFVSSGWSTIDKSLADSADTPANMFIEPQSFSSTGSEISLPLNQTESIVICQRDQATELQDAINMALGDANELGENRSKLGADILAALRGMRNGQGWAAFGKHPQWPRLRRTDVSGDFNSKKSSRFCEKLEKGEGDACLVNAAKPFLRGFQNDLASRLGESIMGEAGKEERGTSTAMSIILPLSRQPEEAVNPENQLGIHEASAVGREFLVNLESKESLDASQPPGQLLPRSTTTPSPAQQGSMHGFDTVGGSCWRWEPARTANLMPPSSCQESSLFDSKNDRETAGRNNGSLVGDCVNACAGALEEHNDSNIIFDTANSLLHTATKGVHDSAGTLGACTRDTAGCSSMSQMSEGQGNSWASLDAGNSIGFSPSCPQHTAHTESQQLQRCPQGSTRGLHGEETNSTFDTNTFYECLPNASLEPGAAGPFIQHVSRPLQKAKSDYSGFHMPALSLDHFGCKRAHSQEVIEAIARSPKNWPNIPDLTPRTLQRWELDLKLIWMGEDEDDLVAEVRDGSSSVFGAPRVPPVSDDDGDDDDASESGQCFSPVNTVVASSAPECAAHCEAPHCDGIDEGQESIGNHKDTRGKLEAGQIVEAVDHSVLEIVDRMLLEVTGDKSKIGHGAVEGCECNKALAEDPLHVNHSTTDRRADGNMKGNIKSRKEAILSDMRSQLEQLKELMVSNAPHVHSKGFGNEANDRTEFPKPMLQVVNETVIGQDKDLMASSNCEICIGHNVSGTEESRNVHIDDSNPSITKEGFKVMPAKKQSCYNSDAERCWLPRATSTSGILSSADCLSTKSRTSRRAQSNPRAAVLLYNMKEGSQHLDETGTAPNCHEERRDKPAERMSVIDGLQRAQKMLSERLKGLISEKAEPALESVQITSESLSDTPYLQPVPPDLYRKGTFFGATLNGIQTLQVEHGMKLLQGRSEKSLKGRNPRVAPNRSSSMKA